MVFRHIFVLVIFAFAVDALRVNNCKGKMPVKIEFINTSPLRAGARANFNGRFTVSGATGTNFRLFVTLKRGGQNWRSQTNLSCRKLVQGGCPPGRGTYNAKNQRVLLPAFLPGGSYQVDAVLRERGSNRKIACGNFRVNIQARG
ncbi:hypothetical protein ACROYT_G001098 [Oculina patagonica]